jgi:Ran GTPase-activating protein (RanGAP) involved in mRNA processing and transport
MATAKDQTIAEQ